jgi:lipopolysaccharide export system protein LptA
MKPNKAIGFFAIVVSLFLVFIPGEAQEKKGIGKGGEKGFKTNTGFGFTASRAPIYIDSDTLEANQKEVIYKGNVVARQEDMTLYANTLTIIYDSETKKLKEIIATGNVKVVQLDRRATGQKVTFDQDENKVVLDGDAVIREGANVIRGERITFYVEEERSVVESGKGGRVTTSITPPPKEEGEEKKPKGEKKKSPELLKEGKRIYEQACASCHGSNGDGKGSGGAALDPRPTDFGMPLKEWPHTKGDSQKVFEVISKGIPSSAMTAWTQYSEQQRWGLVYSVMDFSVTPTKKAK